MVEFGIKRKLKTQGQRIIRVDVEMLIVFELFKKNQKLGGHLGFKHSSKKVPNISDVHPKKFLILVSLAFF